MTQSITPANPYPPNIANWEDRGPNYGDMPPPENPEIFLEAVKDIINPLQHIPIVSNFYRHFSGDQIDAIPRIIGSGLYGGLTGLATGIINVLVEKMTGRDIGGNVLAMILGDPAKPAETLLATPNPHPSPTTNTVPTVIPEPTPLAEELPPPNPLPRPKELVIAHTATPAGVQVASSPQPSIKADTRFLPLRRDLATIATLQDREPSSAIIRSSPSVSRTNQLNAFNGANLPAANISGANAAYSKAIELSNTLRNHYRPTNSNNGNDFNRFAPVQ